MPESPRVLQDAVTEYEAAIQAQPDFQQAQRYLGILYIRLGRTSDAMAHLEAAQHIAPQADVAELLGALRAGAAR